MQYISPCIREHISQAVVATLSVRRILYSPWPAGLNQPRAQPASSEFNLHCGPEEVFINNQQWPTAKSQARKNAARKCARTYVFTKASRAERERDESWERASGVEGKAHNQNTRAQG